MRFLFGIALLTGLSGCAPVLPAASSHDYLIQAKKAGFSSRVIKSSPLWISAWIKIQTPGAPVRVYIEGDGQAWLSRRRPSLNPTPRNPVALRLALLDSAPNVIYLGRPCQYEARRDSACKPYFWTEGRFAPEVIDSLTGAIKSLFPAKQPIIDLVGYSGGGAVVLLLAVRHPECYHSITTVAGILDHEAWTRHHRDAPLAGSLNPATFTRQLQHVPQRHVTGGKDVTVPIGVTQSYARKLGYSACMQIISIRDAAHQDGWFKEWDEIVNTHFICSSE